METAKRLLEEGGKSFNEIMYAVGYEDLPFFRKVFVRLTGLRPKEYQQRFIGFSSKPVFQARRKRGRQQASSVGRRGEAVKTETMSD